MTIENAKISGIMPAEFTRRGRNVEPDCRCILPPRKTLRPYRAEFEKRDASFAHLVVFGMHGVSATVRGLLDQAGLSEDDLPVMMLAPAADPCAVTAVRLPPGESIEGADDPNGGGTCDYLAAWQDVLDRISITRPGRPLRLMGVQGQKLNGVDLRDLASTTLDAVAAS